MDSTIGPQLGQGATNDMEQLYDVKGQFVCGKGPAITDMTGDNLPGKEQGDHRFTVVEKQNVSKDVADIVLAAGAVANEKIAEACKELFEVLDKVGIDKADLLKGISFLAREDVTDADYLAFQVRVFKHD